MILFYISEAIHSVLRAKASFILTVLSLTISVILFLCSVIAIQSSDYLEKRIKEIFKVNLFIKESFPDSDFARAENELKLKIYVSGVSFISKEEAANLFIKETGEDFKSILDYNPLPASFVIDINENYANADSLTLIIDDLSKLEYTDEVIFQNQFVYRILSFINSIKTYLFGLTALVIFIAVYMVYTTINLIINSRRTELETMKLIGARLFTIKFPVLLNGLFAGILASLVCLITYYVFTGYFISFSNLTRLLSDHLISHYIILIFAGPVSGCLVTYLALKKITLKI